MTHTPRVRRRLTLWYSGVMLALLGTTVVAMRAFGRQALVAEHEASVDRSVQLVRSFFRAELAEYRQIEVTLAHIAGELVFPSMDIQFLRPNGALFARARTPQGAALLEPLREVTAPLDAALAPGWQIRLRLSTAELEAGRARLDRLTRIAIPLAVALAALFGWLATGRALRPVGDMARAAEHIESDRTARMPIADAQDEFGRLGGRFNAVLDRLDASIDLQRRFLADAAHELRTPIARALSTTESQLETAPLSNADRSALTDVRQELLHMGALVSELLQVARADAGALPVARDPLQLDDLVADAVVAWQTTAASRSQRLEITTLDDATVAGDHRLVRQLVDILLDNALRYSPESGRICVSVTTGVERAAVAVDDSGPGIPPADRARIFERFFRGETARTMAPHGSGLGLAIARWIAEQHGATLTMDDSSLGGARLVAAFPVTRSAVAP